VVVTLCESPGVVGFKSSEGSIEHFPARHNHDIPSRLHLESWFVAPEQFARQTLGAVSFNGCSQLAARRDAEPRPAGPRNHDHRHEPSVVSDSLGIDALEIAAVSNAFSTRQAGRGRHDQPSSATVSRFRPLERRRFSTIRPFFVDIRIRNPCAFLRRRVFG
jgi:hypothetical protein